MRSRSDQPTKSEAEAGIHNKQSEVKVIAISQTLAHRGGFCCSDAILPYTSSLGFLDFWGTILAPGPEVFRIDSGTGLAF